ncbi:MAG: hypothetical protein JOZ01_07835 [Candidatus Eremiobacteraeota bacterium]|nr:hypothetical protein [Candidatus Eremiobacteraeota bacterium]
MNVEPFRAAHGFLTLKIDAGMANRILLALEHLDQNSGLDPALSTLREQLRAGLVTKSSGDTDSTPSTE